MSDVNFIASPLRSAFAEWLSEQCISIAIVPELPKEVLNARLNSCERF